MSQVQDIYETEYFELYQDRNGKYWLWNKVMECNHAIRAKTELEAYRDAVDAAIYLQDVAQRETHGSGVQAQDFGDRIQRGFSRTH